MISEPVCSMLHTEGFHRGQERATLAKGSKACHEIIVLVEIVEVWAICNERLQMLERADGV
eukprot:CAMPEP_0174746766 /NCGR_PEP_ID=MMETSP1094-20130205/89799_1 /TAXON_ID=156173 /ORGANISM="Chrysochromulina brevifilum, Strain UTEX LB 985" /LENGTH=60 /DNA_ID=CAMNT_0015951535 /DNA_START=63 /DNA_END=242 /DNA_ORIENTATION=-